jgi:tetratricopeptide (TPR) repeat protein
MARKKTLPIRVRRMPPKVEKAEPRQIKRVKLEINTDRVEESIRQAVERLQYWYRQGMIHKVRLKYRGKAILPDIPLSYFMLVQVATFFLTGVVRALALNIGTRVFFEVEMINDAEEVFKRAKDVYLDGDLDEALTLLQEALTLDKDFAEAHLYLGIIHKIRKEYQEAARCFQQAQKLDRNGKIAREAARSLKKMVEAASVDGRA